MNITPTLTVITPAHNEEANLPALFERLRSTLREHDLAWEWIIVDDRSSDGTFGVIARLSDTPGVAVRGIRFARNYGSHTAVACGLHHARGSAAVVMAADLQDPPESIPSLLEKWGEGYQVVWAARRARVGEKATTVGFSRLYYAIMRHLAGMQDMPSSGADFFLIDRRVIDAFAGFRESNVSVFALITWMGFRQTTVTYDKQARAAGKSSWTLSKKLKLLVDSVTSFTYVPIRVMSYVGFVTAGLGLCYALFVIGNAILGHPTQGWSSLIVVVLLLGGVQMVMMGVLGEYVWRALDEARGRPRYLIEATTANVTAAGPRGGTGVRAIARAWAENGAPPDREE